MTVKLGRQSLFVHLAKIHWLGRRFVTRRTHRGRSTVAHGCVVGGAATATRVDLRHGSVLAGLRPARDYAAGAGPREIVGHCIRESHYYYGQLSVTSSSAGSRDGQADEALCACGCCYAPASSSSYTPAREWQTSTTTALRAKACAAP